MTVLCRPSDAFRKKYPLP